MSGKILWTGLTMLVAFPTLFPTFPALPFFGAFVMAVGLVLLWLDK